MKRLEGVSVDMTGRNGMKEGRMCIAKEVHLGWIRRRETIVRVDEITAVQTETNKYSVLNSTLSCLSFVRQERGFKGFCCCYCFLAEE